MVLAARVFVFSVLLTGLGALAPATAATCGHDWAHTGAYTVEGDFRGKIERTTARLANNCRVSINLPGVFTGGPVAPAGECLKFSFKVEGAGESFVATWCEGYALVPWNGRNMRAKVFQTRAQAGESSGRPERADQWGAH